MLYTPLLPEAASGTIEPRHVVVPLREMCPHAELVLGRVTGHDHDRRSRDGRVAGRSARDRLRAPRRRARRDDAHVPGPRPRRARRRVQGPRRRDRAPKQGAAAAGARVDSPRRPVGARVRLRRRGLCGRRGARGAERHGPSRASLLSRPSWYAAALGARRRGAEDPARDPARAREVRGPAAREARRRDPRGDDARVLRRHRGGTRGRDANPRPDARVDRGRPREPPPAGPRSPARRAWAGRGRRGDCASSGSTTCGRSATAPR